MRLVLLTDAQQRKTLAAARSLGKQGIKVIAAEETNCTPTAYSKYCSKQLRSPHPEKNPQAYTRWLIKTLQDNPCDTFFPMDDATTKIALENRVELSKLTRMALPPWESYCTAADKGLSLQAVQEAGVPCPETCFPNQLSDLEELKNRLSYPLVIKPRKSSGSRGIRVIKKKEDLIEMYQKIHQQYDEFPLIQEYLPPGERYDVCLLYDKKSILRASFIQKELRHFPLEMGPSTVQESIYFPELLETAKRIMDGLSWYGIVELEFMRDPRDGVVKFMEINPRFWNSLHMAILAGIDFPLLLYQVALDENIKDQHTYEVGLKCRWLLPGDSLHFIFNRKRFQMNPPFLSGKKRKVYDDIMDWNDPGPLLGFILACGRYVLDLKMWNSFFKR